MYLRFYEMEDCFVVLEVADAEHDAVLSRAPLHQSPSALDAMPLEFSPPTRNTGSRRGTRPRRTRPLLGLRVPQDSTAALGGTEHPLNRRPTTNSQQSTGHGAHAQRQGSGTPAARGKRRGARTPTAHRRGGAAAPAMAHGARRTKQAAVGSSGAPAQGQAAAACPMGQEAVALRGGALHRRRRCAGEPAAAAPRGGGGKSKRSTQAHPSGSGLPAKPP